jgi:hypothetical protein
LIFTGSLSGSEIFPPPDILNMQSILYIRSFLLLDTKSGSSNLKPVRYAAGGERSKWGWWLPIINNVKIIYRKKYKIKK